MYCGPALGLSLANAVKLTLLFSTFLRSGLASALICLRLGCADADTRYVSLCFGHGDMNMQGMTVKKAASWSVSWGFAFYNQPSDGTSLRNLIRWIHDVIFLAVSDCAVCMDF